MQNINIVNQLPQDFSPESRVWIYQSNRAFNEQDEKEINEQLLHFAQNWQSHTIPVKGFGKLFFQRFIILMADESATGVSGCSTDSSVRLIKSLEKQFAVLLFDRLLILFLVKDKLETLPLNQVQPAFEKGFINEHTLFFNNTVLNKKDLESSWIIPVKNSWLIKKIQPFPQASS